MNVAIFGIGIGGLATGAFAQEGRIYGTISDTSKAVMPGVTVTITNLGTGLVQTAVTTSQGQYEVRGLPRGRYTILAELQGFGSVRRPDIDVGIDARLEIDLTMSVGSVSESLTVTGEAPLIDTRSSTVGANISEDQIQSLPVQARQWINLATLLPGVGQDAIRAKYYNNVNIGAGLTYYANGFYVDGVINNWQQQGEPRQDYPQDAIAEFRVNASNAPSQYGWFQGGVLTSVTKSGSNVFHGDAFEYFRNATLNAQTVFDTVKPDYRRNQTGGAIGGPIVKNKAQFYASAEYTNEHKFFNVNTKGIYPNLDGQYEAPQWIYMIVGRYDQQIGQKQRGFVRIAGENNRYTYLNAGGTVAANGGFNFSAPRLSVVGGHTWVLGAGTLNEFRAQYAPATYVGWPSSPGTEFTTAGSFPQQRLDSIPIIYNRPSVSQGTASSFVGPERRWEVKDDFTHALGSHDLTFGADFNWILWTPDNLGVSQTWTFATDLPFDSNNPRTYPNLFTQRLSPTYNRVPSTEHAAYVQDTWRITNRFTANIGLRYDVQTGVWNESLLTEPQPAIVLPSHVIFQGGLLPPSLFPYYDARTRGDKDDFGPRVGFNWKLDHDGNQVIRGAYGVYYNRYVANSGGTRGELNPLQYQVIIRNPNYPDPYNGQDPFALAAAIKNISVMGNNNQNPRTQQYSVGYTGKIGAQASVSIDGTFADGSYEATEIDANYFAAPDAVKAGVRPNATYGQVAQFLTDGIERYRSLEVRLDRRMANRWQMLVSYTLANARASNIGLPADQFNRAAEYGYAPADRRSRLTASGTVLLKGDVSVSGILTYMSSLPFEVTAGKDLNGDGVANDRPPGVTYEQGCRGVDLNAVNGYRASNGLAAVGSVRCSSYVTVDVHAAKSFRLAGSNKMDVVFQVFNILNRANYAPPLGNALSPLFGQSTSVTPARQGEIAIRFAF
jgi:hypothetical protein